MGPIRLISAILLILPSLLSISVLAFSMEFEITDLEIDSPFQADPTSIINTTISFVFNDHITPKAGLASCYLSWAVGLDPPSEYARGACSDASVHAWFPKGTYNGVTDFQVEITHTYGEESVGLPPYNINTSYGFLNVTYDEAGELSGYKCDMNRGNCHSESDTRMVAVVRYATAWMMKEDWEGDQWQQQAVMERS